MDDANPKLSGAAELSGELRRLSRGLESLTVPELLALRDQADALLMSDRLTAADAETLLHGTPLAR